MTEVDRCTDLALTLAVLMAVSLHQLALPHNNKGRAANASSNSPTGIINSAQSGLLPGSGALRTLAAPRLLTCHVKPQHARLGHMPLRSKLPVGVRAHSCP